MGKLDLRKILAGLGSPISFSTSSTKPFLELGNALLNGKHFKKRVGYKNKSIAFTLFDLIG